MNHGSSQAGVGAVSAGGQRRQNYIGVLELRSPGLDSLAADQTGGDTKEELITKLLALESSMVILQPDEETEAAGLFQRKSQRPLPMALNGLPAVRAPTHRPGGQGHGWQTVGPKAEQ